MTAWTPVTKHTSSYSNAAKNSSGYSNVPNSSITEYLLLIDNTFHFLIDDTFKFYLQDITIAGWNNVSKTP